MPVSGKRLPGRHSNSPLLTVVEAGFLIANCGKMATQAMKLTAKIDGQEHLVTIERGEGRLSASIDGRVLDMEVSEPEPGVYLFKHEGRVFEAFVSGSHVSVGGQAFEVDVIDPKRLRGSGSAAGPDHGHAEIRTAMPGKVVRILKQTGDTVTKGEGVIVVEAMKMQNELKSPRDGTVGEVKVSEGDTVGTGGVLVVID